VARAEQREGAESDGTSTKAASSENKDGADEENGRKTSLTELWRALKLMEDAIDGSKKPPKCQAVVHWVRVTKVVRVATRVRLRRKMWQQNLVALVSRLLASALVRLLRKRKHAKLLRYPFRTLVPPRGSHSRRLATRS
jgi:hypothetical protein